jgi:two-component system, sensor histidine kinase
MKRIKILIVDDYQENITALSRLIESDDVEVFSATNANGALELITQHEFGLALLDVQMPVTSGFELAKIIRQVKRFRSLPIIFVTAHQQDSSVVFEGYSSGAVDVLFKPLSANIVRAKVRVFVELAQQRGLMQQHVAELEQLRIEAEAANIAKSQFLANMSHEIRTPLAAVMGFSELISRKQSGDSESKELIAAIERNGKLLLRLIDDILDLSKVEANRLELEKTEFNLADLLRDVGTTLSFRAKEKGLDLSFDIPPEITSNYISDPIRIKQIFLNIIGNAIKFTHSGSIQVDVSIQTGVQANKRVHTTDRILIKVKDQGVGLTEQEAERLFQPFGQADPSTRRHFGGSGLGLVISRQIARALDGDVRLVASAPGAGTTFGIELLLERSLNQSVLAEKQPVKTPLASVTDFAGKQILVVDDSPDNLTLIELFLGESGADLTFVENGLGAIGEVQNKKFDLILMDIQMPGMDGHEATTEIRRLGFRKPIVALTAHAIKSEHDKCRKAGCDSVLTKPISRASLVEGISPFLL